MSVAQPRLERGQIPIVRAERPNVWAVVFERELRDLWTGGRALVMCFAFSLLLSVIAYLVATNTDLNFLEQRESVSLTLQVAIAVGALLALLVAGDAFSGERERGTLETMLLTPASSSPCPMSGGSGTASESWPRRSPPAS
jgi:ABC-2 type transport system permease protein